VGAGQLFLGALGLGAALAGGLLGSQLPAIPVSLLPGRYTLGPVALLEVHPGVYRGAAVVVVVHRGGATVAAGSTVWGTQPTSGLCTETAGHEACTFTIGRTHLTATDQLDRDPHGLAWVRVYSSGVHVTIPLPAGPAPVPIPLGLAP